MGSVAAQMNEIKKIKKAATLNENSTETMNPDSLRLRRDRISPGEEGGGRGRGGRCRRGDGRSVRGRVGVRRRVCV